MSLEDLQLRINVGVLQAESALSTLGKIEGVVDRISAASVAMAAKVGQGIDYLAVQGGKAGAAVGRVYDSAKNGLVRLGEDAKRAAAGIEDVTKKAVVASGMISTLGMVVEKFGAIGSFVGGRMRLLGTAIVHMSHVVHAAKFAFSSLGNGIRIVLAPVIWLVSGLMNIARAVWAVVGPIVRLGIVIYAVWFAIKGWVSTIKVLSGWLSMLPPKLRLVVGGLLLLGATGKAGALALRVVAGAARMAATAFQLMSLPILICVNPMRALTVAASLLGRALVATGSMALRAATSLWTFAASVGSGVGSVVGMIGGKLLSAAKAGATAFVLLGGAVAAWGVKLAAKAETGAVVFGTMLKNMQQGKALQADLESWSGAPLFDADAVQLSGVLLFKAGIAADQIKGKLDQLGNIAAATKTPVDELAKIYQQGMNQGAFQQDKINQLSDRGIAIYEGLAHATGVSGLALKELIRDGKIGPAEMNAALEHLTTGQGIYAGALNNIGATTEGMWKKLTNTVAFVAREVGINIMSAFDFKGMMASGISFFSNLRSQISNAMPAFTAIATVVKAAFAAVWEVVSVTFSAITGALGMTGGNFMTTFLEMAAIATWAFKNWPDVARLAFINVGLSLVRFGADFAHIFTGVMPALFRWFGDNWKNMFMTAASFVKTMFTNMADNIKNVMKSIWDFIKSGGTKSLTVAWTPLLDGFKNTVKELPDIPPRAIGDLERQLAADSDRLANAVGGSLAAEIDSNMKMLSDFQEKQKNAVAPTLDGTSDGTSGGHGGEDSAIGTASKNAVENKAAFVRSGEGQSVVTQFIRGMIDNGPAKTQAAATIASAKSLANIERDTRKGKTIVSRRLA